MSLCSSREILYAESLKLQPPAPQRSARATCPQAPQPTETEALQAEWGRFSDDDGPSGGWGIEERQKETRKKEKDALHGRKHILSSIAQRLSVTRVLLAPNLGAVWELPCHQAVNK